MSLINFLNAKLKPTIVTDVVFEDGYEPANLIADDAEQLSRGFMAYGVTKPPVEIVFNFPKAIDLKVIKIWNTLGTMRSTAFEIHGQSEGIWERVAYIRDIDKSVRCVTFCYQSDYNSRSDDAAQQHSEKAFFFRTARRIFSDTRSIKIVVRATQKCPPVLQKVEIWGLPARSLDIADRELVKTIWHEITHPLDQQHVWQQQQSGQISPTRSLPELHEDSKLEIPEEFLDAITWELMIFPTVLPSGKIVDQSTIDKHSEVEAKWGRLPSDPFTGLEFTPHRRAILNFALKTRIEKFLTENAEQFKTVPRSLGSTRVRRSKNRHASQFASLHHHNSTAVGTYSCLSAISNTAGRVKRSSSALTHTITSSTAPTTAKRARLADDHRTSNTTTSTSTIASQLPAETTLSVEMRLQEALRGASSRYTLPPTAADTSAYSCIGCQSMDFAYEIQTCKHLVCRECLIKLMQEQMCSCKTSFRNADVERYHRL